MAERSEIVDEAKTALDNLIKSRQPERYPALEKARFESSFSIRKYLGPLEKTIETIAHLDWNGREIPDRVIADYRYHSAKLKETTEGKKILDLLMHKELEETRDYLYE